MQKPSALSVTRVLDCKGYIRQWLALATIRQCMNKVIIIDKYKFLILQCEVEFIAVTGTELIERSMRTICCYHHGHWDF